MYWVGKAMEHEKGLIDMDNILVIARSREGCGWRWKRI